MKATRVNLTKDQRDAIIAMLGSWEFKLFVRTISARADEKQLEAVNDSAPKSAGTNRELSAEAARKAELEYRSFVKVVSEQAALNDFYLIEINPTL